MTLSSSYWEFGKIEGLRNQDSTITQLLLVTLLKPFSNNCSEMVVYKCLVQTVSLLQQAVNFLNSMNWNTEGNACFACMSIIMNNLLKLPLNSEREGKEVSTSLE